MWDAESWNRGPAAGRASSVCRSPRFPGTLAGMAEPAARTKRAAVPNHVVLRIAGEVPAAPDTVRKVIAGLPVRGSVYFRVRDALKRAGFEVPDPDGD
jgi:hypothetical protein